MTEELSGRVVRRTEEPRKGTITPICWAYHGFRETHVTNVAQIVNKMFPVWSRVAPVRSGRYTADQYINILPTEPKRGIKIPRSQPFLNQFRPTYEKCFRWTGNFKKSKCSSLTKYRKLFFAYILITQCSRTGTCDSRS